MGHLLSREDSWVAWVGFTWAAALVALGLPIAPAAGVAAIVVLNAWGIAALLRASPRIEALTAITLGLALSTAVCGLASVLLAPHVAWPWWVLPALGVIWRIARGAPGSSDDRWLGVVATSLAVAGIALLLRWDTFRVPVPDGPLDRVHPDAYVVAALGTGITAGGWGDSGVMGGIPYRYHWMTYAWTGWIEQQAQLPPLTSLSPVSFVVGLSGAALMGGWLARRYLPGSWFALAAAAGALAIGGSLDHYSGSLLYAFVSQSFGALWLLGAFACFALATDDGRRWALIPLGVLSFVAMAGKVSHGAVVIAGAGAFLITRVVQQKQVRRSFAAAGVAVLAAGLGFVTVSSGQPGGGALLPAWVYGPVPWITATAFFGLARLLRWAGLGYALTLPDVRRSAVAPWALGATGASLVVALLLTSPNGNQEYFLDSAMVIAAPLGALGAIAWCKSRSRHPRAGIAIASAVALGVIAGGGLFAAMRFAPSAPRLSPQLAILAIVGTFAAIVAWSARSRGNGWLDALGWLAMVGLIASFSVQVARPLAFPPGTSEPMRYSWARDDLLDRAATDPELTTSLREAANWLRSNTAPTDILVVSDPTTAWLPALAGRRAFASFPEQVLAWAPAESRGEVDRRQGLVRDLLAGSIEARQALCSAEVRWLIDARSSAERSGAPVVERFGAVSIVDLCP